MSCWKCHYRHKLRKTMKASIVAHEMLKNADNEEEMSFEDRHHGDSKPRRFIGVCSKHVTPSSTANTPRKAAPRQPLKLQRSISWNSFDEYGPNFSGHAPFPGSGVPPRKFPGNAAVFLRNQSSRDFYQNQRIQGSHAPTSEVDEVVQIQKQILKAKNEAKTVTVLDGNLYIDYKYIGPLPMGCRV